MSGLVLHGSFVSLVAEILLSIMLTLSLYLACIHKIRLRRTIFIAVFFLSLARVCWGCCSDAQRLQLFEQGWTRDKVTAFRDPNEKILPAPPRIRLPPLSNSLSPQFGPPMHLGFAL